jgi:hypothetical protein
MLNKSGPNSYILKLARARNLTLTIKAAGKKTDCHHEASYRYLLAKLIQLHIDPIEINGGRL